MATLDQFARTAGLPSRPAALRHAVRLLRLLGLEQDYAVAWDEWEASDDQAEWASTVADGSIRAAR